MIVVYRPTNILIVFLCDSASETLYDNNNTYNWIGISFPRPTVPFQVYIVGHIPPGSDERDQAASLTNGHQFFSQKNNLRYLDLVRKYSQIIRGQFFGHLHSDSFRIVYNDMGE